MKQPVRERTQTHIQIRHEKGARQKEGALQTRSLVSLGVPRTSPPSSLADAVQRHTQREPAGLEDLHRDAGGVLRDPTVRPRPRLASGAKRLGLDHRKCIREGRAIRTRLARTAALTAGLAIRARTLGRVRLAPR